MITSISRRCLLGLSLGAACAGAAAHPVTALADYSLEQLSEMIVAPAPVAAAGTEGGDALRAFPASGYPAQQADSVRCVQPRRLWSKPPARSGRLIPGALAAPAAPERAH